VKLFWLFLTIACLAWYSTVTVYIALRGGREVREMLKRFKNPQR
jgi:hypothetical protein